MAEMVLPRILNVVVTATSIQVDLNDGRTVLLPIGWYPRIEMSDANERARWRLVADGLGVHWEDIDEDLSVENVLLGRPSAESQTSLQAWLSGRTPRKPAHRQRRATS